MIYENATARHLGFARIVVFGVLLVRLLLDPLEQLANFPFGAFLPHGPLQFIPDAWMNSLLAAGHLLAFKWIYAGVLLLCLVGAGPRCPVMLTAICGTVFYDGLAKGFGGHINHQELIVTHCAILLVLFPCYDGLSVNHLIRRKDRNTATTQQLAAYRLALRALCFWITLTYFFVGLARISSSGVKGYFTNTINFYALQQSLRWGYWDVSLARHLLDQKWLQILLSVSFPLATLLEIAAPLAVFIRKLTIPIVLSLLVFHTMIFLFMNFFFWQNMVLLSLFFAAFVGRETEQRCDEASGSGIVFSG
jgi:hypothetical protein